MGAGAAAFEGAGGGSRQRVFACQGQEGLSVFGGCRVKGVGCKVKGVGYVV